MTVSAPLPLFDSLIIGDGIAGLSTAASLVRTLHTAVVFTNGAHRNDAAPHLATIPSWDSCDPHRFRHATKRSLLAKYSTVQFADVPLARVERLPPGAPPQDGEARFRVTDDKGRQWLGKTVVLAMGVHDIFPADLPGYENCWITSIFHCLVHRGYEERGCPSAGILAVDGDADAFAAQHLAFQARNLTAVVTIYTHGDAALTAAVAAALAPLGFRIEGRRIAALRPLDGADGARVEVRFADGAVAAEGFLVHRPRTAVNGPFARQLGVAMAPQGHVVAGFPFHETSVAGCFVAGDAGSPFKIGTQAVVMGAFAAGGVQAMVNRGNWGVRRGGTVVGEEEASRADGQEEKAAGTVEMVTDGVPVEIGAAREEERREEGTAVAVGGA
ncbi:hypothetical protein MMC11_004271 [Xylographa trunciseda]|nr:hypothetical protein [Xylographa trunciseda]